MQEAYWPPCSEYSFCSPNWVTPPPSWPGPGGRGYPAGGYPLWVSPHPDLAGGYPAGGNLPGYSPILTCTPAARSGWRAPYLGIPWSRVPLAGYLPLAGYPPTGTHPGRVPPQQGTPLAGPGRVPPRCLPHGILGNVAKHYGIWVPPWCLPHGILGNVAKHYGIWVPPPVDRQMDGWTDTCQNITFPSCYVRGR